MNDIEDTIVVRGTASFSPAGPDSRRYANFSRPALRRLSSETAVIDAVAQLAVSVEPLNLQQRAELRRDPEVAAIARAMPLKLIAPTHRAEAAARSDSWGLAAIGVGPNTAYDGAGVTVAVLDTGIDRTHPAFAHVTFGADDVRDFTGEGDDDREGHGTHCAGTIFGQPVDGVRIGVAPGISRAMIGKVLSANGGSSKMLFNALDWAISGGAQVVSMSLGFDFPGMVARLERANWPTELATSNALSAFRGNLDVFNAIMMKNEALARAGTDIAEGSGAVIIAATGNESRVDLDPDFRLSASLPAAAAGTIPVGALQLASPGRFALAAFSNGGAAICGPGVEIVSARAGGGFATMSGTSMATPHIAGLAVLWAQALGQFNYKNLAEAVASRLMATARKAEIDRFDVATCGEGLARAP